MRGKIGFVTVLADDALGLVKFYCETLGFSVKDAYDDRIELENDGVRFAICSRSMMENLTGHSSYGAARAGQSFALAFPLRTHQEVDEMYRDMTSRGAVPILSPMSMPWGQRTAFFADPEGNIHQLFADQPQPAECCW